MADPAKDKFVTALRVQAGLAWAAQNELELLVEEFNARGWSGAIAAEDINDQNADVTPQQVADFIGSVGQTSTLWNNGVPVQGNHASNYAKMIKR